MHVVLENVFCVLHDNKYYIVYCIIHVHRAY